MKNRDIEERTKKVYPIDGTNMMVGLIQRNSYMLGALEQKAIDIDKACEWLKNNLREYGIILFGHWESDFRKAMEE